MKSLLISLFFLTSIEAFSTVDKKVGIAVIDSPIDYSHPDIISVLDSDLMKSISVIDDKGDEKAWYQINEEVREVFEESLDQGKYRKQLNFLDALVKSGDTDFMNSLEESERKEIERQILSGLIHYKLSPRYRKQMELIGRYIHGTHIAGIVASGASDIRLVNIPFLEKRSKQTPSGILKFDASANRQELRRYFRDVSRVLEEANVRVVNLSIGGSKEAAFEAYKSEASFFVRIILRNQLKKVAEQVFNNFVSELESFLQLHPNIVFVMSAGNDGLDLSDLEMHSAKITQPNLVKVASVNRAGALAPLSNRSNKYVDIAALGVNVGSALINGGHIYLSGTSQAAANISNALVKIFGENPEMSAEKAIEKLYSDFSTPIMKLRESVRGGKMLTAVREDWLENNLLRLRVDVDGFEDNLTREEFAAAVSEFVEELREHQIEHEMEQRGAEQLQVEFFNNGQMAAIQKLSVKKGVLEYSFPLELVGASQKEISGSRVCTEIFGI